MTMNHDPGGKRIFAMPPGMEGSAHFSECGRYRHALHRRWGTEIQTILFIGLNPSTATADRNDPTIVREVSFARREGFNCYTKVNLLDYRATNPKVLIDLDFAARSDQNLKIVLEMAHRSDKVVAAWGALHGAFTAYATELQNALNASSVKLFCLGTTKGGFPRHPLYVRSDTPLIEHNLNATDPA